MSRDIIKIQEKNFEDYTKAKVFDIWMSFDERDCEKYGFPHFDEFESKINIPIDKDYPVSDVFFAGKAKDRLPRLVKIYDRLTEQGAKCLFYITEAKPEEKVQREGIIYSNAPMSYAKMLWYSVNSRCILEISQADAIGYTSRFLEAVLFNKLLITDNSDIKKTNFYNPDFIQLIRSEEDIDATFLNKSEEVDYNYNQEFSPVKRVELIEELLSKK